LKRKIPLLSFLLLVVTLCACNAGGQGSDTVGNTERASKGLEFTLSFDEKSYSVTGMGDCADKDIVIPSEYEGLPVTCIGVQAFSGTDITSATIPDSVTRIEERAFAGLVYCKSIIIPNSVTEIGGYAFANSYALESVDMTSSLQTISEGLFYECHSLKSIIIPDGVESIGGGAFDGCTQLVAPSLPQGVTEIGESAFARCEAFESVVLPDSVGLSVTAHFSPAEISAILRSATPLSILASRRLPIARRLGELIYPIRSKPSEAARLCIASRLGK